MKGKMLNMQEVQALKNDTKVIVEWDNWLGKGEGEFVKDLLGVEVKSKPGNGFYFDEFEKMNIKVFEAEAPKPKKPDMEKIRAILGIKPIRDIETLALENATVHTCMIYYKAGYMSYEKALETMVEVLVDQNETLFKSILKDIDNGQ